jgi:hypothetical protein
MTSNNKRRGVLAAIGSLAGAIALVLGASVPANAVAITNIVPNTVISSSPVTVSGPIDAGTDAVAITLCDTTVTLGTQCTEAFTWADLPPVTAAGTFSGDLDVSEVLTTGGFWGYDYTSGVPTATLSYTTCLGSTGNQCAIVVSQYDWSVTPNPQTDADAVNVLF